MHGRSVLRGLEGLGGQEMRPAKTLDARPKMHFVIFHVSQHTQNRNRSSIPEHACKNERSRVDGYAKAKLYRFFELLLLQDEPGSSEALAKFSARLRRAHHVHAWVPVPHRWGHGLSDGPGEQNGPAASASL